MDKATHWRDSSDLAMLFRSPRGTRYYRWLHAHTHARFRLGLMRTSRERGFVERSRRALWYAVRFLITHVGLAWASRDRVQMRALPPELSREGAAAPSLQAPSRPADL